MPIIQSLERALRILELFDEHARALKITEISARLGLHKSTVHSLLKTLQLHGYIDQDKDDGKYRLGLKLVEKGQLVLQGMDIRGIARPHLAALSQETGQTAHLVILDDREAVYIDKVEGERAAIRYSRIGRKVPLHSSAVGKVLAAYRPREELADWLTGYVFAKHTAATIDSPEAFLRELDGVREKGFAVDLEENESGVRCAASPIFNHAGEAVAAMSVSTMIANVGDDEFQDCIGRLRRSAAHISRSLGHKPVIG